MVYFCTKFYHRRSPIHVPSGFYIVKSINHKILRLKKLIRVQSFFCFWANCEKRRERKKQAYQRQSNNDSRQLHAASNYHNILLSPIMHNSFLFALFRSHSIKIECPIREVCCLTSFGHVPPYGSLNG